MIEGEASPMAISDEWWQQLMQTGLTTEGCSSTCYTDDLVFNQLYQEGLRNLNSFMDSGVGEDYPWEDLDYKFIDSDVVSSQMPQIENPRDFTDAWWSAAAENPANACTGIFVSSEGRLPVSSLAHSREGDAGIEDEIGYDEMVLRMLHGSESCHGSGSEGCHGCGSEDLQLSTWQTPASSSGWAPGGEFAEALEWSTVVSGSNAASLHGGNDDAISLYEVAASCSSGVLLEPAVSPSAICMGSSQTLQVPPCNAEITFPRLYQRNAASPKATPAETSDRFRSQTKLKEKLMANKKCCLRAFQNREKGLKKKIAELCTLCGIQACCVIYCPFCPRPHIWPQDQNEVESIAKEYMKNKKYH